VVQTIQLGIPVARVELLDDVQMMSINRHAGLDYPEQTTLFFEFHGSAAGVAEQAETVQAIAGDNGGGGFLWATRTEDRNKLWKARHNALYANLALKPGSVGWATDVCVPIGNLAQCILQTKEDLKTASMPAPIVGHVGDGNFHTVFLIDPTKPEELAEAERLNARLVQRALDLDGTCTGEHGIGFGKMEWLERELGPVALDAMRAIKTALDPKGIMNPGKIFRA
jgi:D-lactate dehydrogenase (cytochrome)